MYILKVYLCVFVIKSKKGFSLIMLGSALIIVICSVNQDRS